jgi:hypothetical protein
VSGVNAIVETCHHLTILQLDRCDVTDQTLSLLADSRPPLTTLILEGCTLYTDVSFVPLTACLPFLDYVDISGNTGLYLYLFVLTVMCYAVLCCAVLTCAVLNCAVLYYAVL